MLIPGIEISFSLQYAVLVVLISEQSLTVSLGRARTRTAITWRYLSPFLAISQFECQLIRP